MPRLALFVLIMALAFHPAMATGAPSPANSTVPPLVKVLTVQPYGLDQGDVYSVVVRDEFGNPMSGVPVFLDFAPCSHVIFAAEQPYATGVVTDCVAETLRAVTNPAGIASFAICGSVIQRSPPISDAGCVKVYAVAVSPPTLLGAASPAAFDEDGVNGLTANDLSLFLCDQFSGVPYARSDFNGTGGVNALDLTLWLQKYYKAKGNARTADRCDGSPSTTPLVTVSETPLRLRWMSCGGPGMRTFTCDDDTGSDKLVASFVVPEEVSSLSGFDALIWVAGDPGTPIADWWRFDNSGCRANVPTIAAGGTGAGSCIPIQTTGLSWTVLQASEYPGLLGEFENVVIIRITGAVTQPADPLEPGQEYALFTLTIPHTSTTGEGACTGCSEPVALALQWVKLRQSGVATVGCSLPNAGNPLPDYYIRGGPNAIAYWQGTTTPPPVDVIPAPATAEGLNLTVTNPSLGGARIGFALPRTSRCTLAIFDISGRRQRVLVDELVPAGTRTLDWDGRDEDGRSLPSGYFIVRLETEEGTLTRALIHLR